jgi:hypothetical protein
MRAFGAFGGVPKMIRYDSFKTGGGPDRFRSGTFRTSAVRGNALPLRLRLILLRSKHRRGRMRRVGWKVRSAGSATPIPHLGSLEALNTALAAADARDDARRIGGRTETVGKAAARELLLLTPLPAETVRCGGLARPRSTVGSKRAVAAGCSPHCRLES